MSTSSRAATMRWIGAAARQTDRSPGRWPSTRPHRPTRHVSSDLLSTDTAVSPASSPRCTVNTSGTLHASPWEDIVNAITQLVARIAYPFLRIAMGIVLVWIGGLKFVDPAPVVGLIGASPFAFLASNGFVYLLGLGEVVVGGLLFANVQVKYVGILTMGLFVGTLAILILTPKVAYGDAGFPLLSLPGEFLLKDLVLMAASASLSAMASAHELGQMMPTERRTARAA